MLLPLRAGGCGVQLAAARGVARVSTFTDSAARALSPGQLSAQRDREAAWQGGSTQPVSLTELEEAATALRVRLDLPPHRDDALGFDSQYTRADGSKRSWCHWLVPGRVMVGRYPHQDPTAHPDLHKRNCPSCGGPTVDEAEAHLKRLLKVVRVTCFVSLLDEVPPQEVSALWPPDGRHFFANQDRAVFPAPFVRYFDAAVRAAEACSSDAAVAAAVTGAPPERGKSSPAHIDDGNFSDGIDWGLDGPARCSPPSFVHFPMRDCSVPWSDAAAYALLAELVSRMDDNDDVLYIHCWSGRGRAGLIGGALLALLRPELAPAEVLRITQAGYDSRAGAGLVPARGRRSPQTSEQVAWLEDFASELKHLALGLRGDVTPISMT